MDIAKQFQTDPTLEVEGVWVPMDKETSVLLARQGNPRYREALRRLSAPYRQAARIGAMSDEAAEVVLIEVMADTIVLGWKGMKEKVQDLPYSKANAIRVLTEYPNFREFCAAASGEMETYKITEDLADAKN